MPADASPPHPSRGTGADVAGSATAPQAAGLGLLAAPALLRPAHEVAAVLAALRERGAPGDAELAGLLADGGSARSDASQHAAPLHVDLRALAADGGTVATSDGPLDVPAPAAADPDRRLGEVRAWRSARGHAALPPG